MPRISINEMTTYHWSFDEDVTHYEAVGVGGVGVWRRKLNEFGDERGIEMLADSRLKVSSLACAGGFTGSDGYTFREAVDDALDALRLAADMKAGCLIVVTGARAGHTANHARRLAVEALKELGDVGAALGVQIAVQPAHRQPTDCWTFLTSLEATLELLGRCNHRQVGMVFDVVKFWNEASTIGGLAEIVPSIKIAGLSDIRSADRTGDHGAPVSACASLPEMIRRLEEHGYRGWYDLKILCEQCWMSDYPRLIADCCRSLRSACPHLFGDSDEAAMPPFAAPPSSGGADSLRFADEPAPPF